MALSDSGTHMVARSFLKATEAAKSNDSAHLWKDHHSSPTEVVAQSVRVDTAEVKPGSTEGGPIMGVDERLYGLQKP